MTEYSRGSSLVSKPETLEDRLIREHLAKHKATQCAPGQSTDNMSTFRKRPRVQKALKVQEEHPHYTGYRETNADIDPQDINPDTNQPYTGYSSPSLDPAPWETER